LPIIKPRDSVQDEKADNAAATRYQAIDTAIVVARAMWLGIIELSWSVILCHGGRASRYWRRWWRRQLLPTAPWNAWPMIFKNGYQDHILEQAPVSEVGKQRGIQLFVG
jgi:hypothetical protein